MSIPDLTIARIRSVLGLSVSDGADGLGASRSSVVMRIVPWLPWLLMLAGLTVTIQLWRYERDHSMQKLHANFDYRGQETLAAIERRWRVHEQVIRGFQGVFAVNPRPDADEFHAFVVASDLKLATPGLRHVLYSRPSLDVEGSQPRPRVHHVESIAAVRLDSGEAAAVFADLTAQAMAQARDRATPLFTVATVPGGVAKLFMIHMPLYSAEAGGLTLGERRSRFLGWLTLAFDLQGMMADILAPFDADLDIEIYDGASLAPETRTFALSGGGRPHGSEPLLRKVVPMQFGGYSWNLVLGSRPDFEARLNRVAGDTIAFVGSLASLLLFAIGWLLLHFRQLAVSVAKDMTRQLKASERRYRLMFEDNASMAYLIRRDDGCFIDANPAALAYWGYSREEVRDMTIFDISAERREAVVKTMIGFDERHGMLRAESHQRLKNGEIREVEVFVGLLDYEGVPAFHVTFHDIVSRRQIEQEQMRKLMVSYPVAVLMVGEDGVIVDVNPAAEQTFRCGSPELIGTRVDTLVPSTVCRRYADEARAYLSSSEPLDVTDRPDLVAVRRDGEEFPFEMRMTPFNLRGRRVVLVSVYDISERKRTESTLRKLERAVENSPMSIAITDPNGCIEYVNPVFCAVMGFAREEVVGKVYGALLAMDTPRDMYQAFWQAVTTGGVWRGELRYRRKDEALFWQEAAIAPVTDEAGVITNFVALSEDITERKRIEAELLSAKEAAEAASKAKSDFLAVMSHEIRTPMNSVIGLGALLLGTSLDAQQRLWLETLESSAKSLLALLNDILDFSKIEAGRMDIEIIDFDLRSLFDQLHALLAVRAAQKGLEFAIRIEPDVPALLRGDPGRLRQIMLNLAGNALKFTARGHVSLDVRRVAEPDDRSRLRFEVRDSGIGIAPESLTTLFTPFTQADASTTRRFGGTGLGLAICKQLVGLMGGEIGAESRPGEGAMFWFEVAFERQPPADEDVGDRSVELSSSRVLVVGPQERLHSLSNPEGLSGLCQLAFVGSPADATDRLANASVAGRPFDALVTDCEGGEAAVTDMAQGLVGDARMAHLAMIYLSAAPEHGEARRVRDAGFNAYLGRPVPTDLFVRCLHQSVVAARGRPREQRPFVTRHSLAESARRARLLLVCEDVAAGELHGTMQVMRDGFGHAVEMVGRIEDAQPPPAGRRYDVVLLAPSADHSRMTETVRRIRAGEVRVLESAVHLIVLSDRRPSDALAADLNGLLSRPVNPLALDAMIRKALAAPPALPSGPHPAARTLANLAARGLRLLVADDNPFNQMVAEGLLRKLGITDVRMVDDGQAAVDAVREAGLDAFDLILMDCQMPVVDGFMATRALRELGCRTPIVALTADAMPGVQRECAAAGMNAYVAKPIVMDDFMRVLHDLTGAAGADIEGCDDARSGVAGENPDVPVLAAGSGAAPPPFDRAGAMERLGGNDALLKELLGVFIGNWPISRERLADALGRGDLDAAKRETHTLKGSSLTVGAVGVHGVALAMNESGIAGALDAMRNLMPHCDEEIRRFFAAVEADQS